MPKVIMLIDPIEGHVPNPAKPGETMIGKIGSITLRDPKYADLMALGEPSSFARSEGGLIYTSEREEVMQAYIERLMIDPVDRSLLQQVSLADAQQLKDAVYDFFHSAREARSARLSKT
jgi:hypothetical protein